MKKIFVIAAMVLIAIGSASAQKKVVENLQQEVATLKQEISTIKGSFETLSSSVESNRQGIQSGITLSNSILSEVAHIKQQIGTLSTLVKEKNASAEIQSLSQKVENLEKLVNEKLATAAAPTAPAKPQYEVVGTMHNGMVLVKEGLLYGYVNSKNEYIIPAKYEEANDFEKGYAKVKKNDKWGIVNSAGKETVACSYDEVRLLVGNIWRVKKGNLFGLVSAANGAIVQPVKYARIGHTNIRGHFNDGCNRYLMCINGKYGFFNEKGQVAIPAKFDDGTIFDERGIANVKLNGKMYTINTSGTIIKDGYTF